MAALTADAKLANVRGPEQERWIQSAITQYWGSLMAGVHASGHTKAVNDTADSFFLGVAQSGQLGDASEEYLVSTGAFIEESVTVAGYTSAALNFKLVYCTTDNINDCTLTRPSDDAVPVGITTKYRSSGVGDVRFFSFAESALLGLSGRAKQCVCLGTFPCNLATGDVATSVFTFYGRCKLITWYIVSDGAGAGAGGDIDLNLEVGTTNVTASQISMLLATQQTQGGRTDVDATMTETEVSDGDILSIEAVQNTAFTAGTFTAFLEYEYMI